MINLKINIFSSASFIFFVFTNLANYNSSVSNWFNKYLSHPSLNKILVTVKALVVPHILLRVWTRSEN